MTTLPKEKFAQVDPSLVAVTLKIRDGVEHTITRKIADYIGAQGPNEKVRLPSGDWINTSDISSMTVDEEETIANLKRIEKPLRMDGPMTTPEQFIVIAEAHASKNAGFREIYTAWKNKLKSPFADALERLSNAVDNTKTLDI